MDQIKQKLEASEKNLAKLRRSESEILNQQSNRKKKNDIFWKKKTNNLLYILSDLNLNKKNLFVECINCKNKILNKKIYFFSFLFNLIY